LEIKTESDPRIKKHEKNLAISEKPITFATDIKTLNFTKK
jgi:hypothetical protein